jgi:CheY-like chemotaxis protein/anti-sigma regulatory factor (Ser/Thr protein kinase)
LKQILVNLLSNAVKFTAAGGSVALMVEADDANKLMRFAVQDTGIGIAAADTERIFQPFTQLDSSLARQHEGTGLGLTLVKRLAELHGGAVSVASEGVAGKGSRFTITLPWRTAEAPSSLPVDATTPARAALPRRPVVLLLVGDNDLDMQPLFDHLHGLGYQLATARTVAEALEQAQLTVPDIALINIHTPPNDDLEAIRRLRALSGLAKTPIIALGASATAENQMHCLEAGADDFMRQPFTPQRLAARMEQFLLRPRSVQP